MKSRIPIICVLFISLLLHSALSIRAQNTAEGSARLIDSFGPVPNGDARGRLGLFLAEISNNAGSKAIIYNHGTPAQIAARTHYHKNQIAFRQFDASRIKFISGRNIGDIRTDMWLIPAGATQPEFKPEAWIFRDIRRANKSTMTRAMSGLDKEAWKLRDHQAYIINYGSPAQIAQRERWIRDAIVFRRFDSYRITLVNGGSGPVRTVMWLVPLGAENPKP